MEQPKIALYWIRNDQRLHDNALLVQAEEWEGKMLPVYVFDPQQWKKISLGFLKTGYFRTQFLLESLSALHQAFQEKGSGIHFVIGSPEQVLTDLARETDAEVVWAQKEHSSEEIRAQEAVAQALPCPLELKEGLTLYHPADVPFGIEEVPFVFREFRKKLEKEGSIRPSKKAPASLPPLPVGQMLGKLPRLWELGVDDEQMDERACLNFKGGEAAGLKRVRAYIWEKDRLKLYKKTRNGLKGPDYSSKFSAWLWNGNLSPRFVYEEIKRYEQERVKNKSTYWLFFELLWRDFFRFQAMKFGDRFFQLGGLRGKEPNYENNLEDFAAWYEGRTGQPFVDANMRELLYTGFMSNRGRQVVASYLTKDLKVDWRWGAAWFENRLIDYDPTSNWGNWMYVAGVGNDPREDRYFNPKSQMEKYDPNGQYRAVWIEQGQMDLF